MQDDMPFRERLGKLFKPTEFARVINIDTEPFSWDYCSEEEVIQDRDSRSVVSRKIDKYELQPGESQVLEGGCAYVAIEKMFRKVLPRETGKYAGILDPVAQQTYIDRIFLGKENPFIKQKVEAKVAEEVAKDEPEQEFATVKPAQKPASRSTSK
jgi:hypothetical protein